MFRPIRGTTRGGALRVLRGELVLLPQRVKRRERVLPLPDDECPGDGKQARDGEHGADQPEPPTHLIPLTPDAEAAMRAEHAWRARFGGGCAGRGRAAVAPPARD